MPVLLIVILIIALWLFLIWPNPGRGRMGEWPGKKLAHRGLHDAGSGIIENTLPAFRRAVEKGYGIELDIQFTRDMRTVVFHDDGLQRLCGDPRLVRDVDYDELGRLCPGGGDAPIPTFREVLDEINGKVPLLIELKSGKKNEALCRSLVEHMKGYPGPYVVESFDPFIVGWFRRNAPEIPRGQLCCAPAGYGSKLPWIGAAVLAALLFSCVARPDFVAYDANARYLAPKLQRLLFHTPLAAWTVRSPELARALLDRNEVIIFESIEP